MDNESTSSAIIVQMFAVLIRAGRAGTHISISISISTYTIIKATNDFFFVRKKIFYMEWTIFTIEGFAIHRLPLASIL